MKARTAAAAGGKPATDTEQEPAWRLLSPRMLAVHPLHEALRFLPVVLGVFVLGHDGEKPWGLIGLALALVIGLGRYFTTTYRVTADYVQVRRGLLRREVLSVPRDRIRSVDVSARARAPRGHAPRAVNGAVKRTSTRAQERAAGMRTSRGKS